mmetsp:Transcript_10442/g.22196  ORF Transcript_10442/g.22196 Transcript_10442/m.22196 type:complete len:228 (-) Transcript_10442:89-772(-)
MCSSSPAAFASSLHCLLFRRLPPELFLRFLSLASSSELMAAAALTFASTLPCLPSSRSVTSAEGMSLTDWGAPRGIQRRFNPVFWGTWEYACRKTSSPVGSGPTRGANSASDFRRSAVEWTLRCLVNGRRDGRKRNLLPSPSLLSLLLLLLSSSSVCWLGTSTRKFWFSTLSPRLTENFPSLIFIPKPLVFLLLLLVLLLPITSKSSSTPFRSDTFMPEGIRKVHSS